MQTYPVYLGSCTDYDPDKILGILTAALQVVKPIVPVRGRVVIKPNLVMAHPKIATDGYTRSEVIEGILKWISGIPAVTKTDIVEKSGLGVTTSTMFRHAGYGKLKSRYPVRLVAMEESRQAVLTLKNGKVHPYIHVAREMAERDFLIFAPKLKTNVLSHAYSGALKLNIGTIDGKERIFQHHQKLPEKIVDILEIANPDLIITDGVRLAFGGNQMTQGGIDFGMIAVSANAVAHDMACAHVLGLDPMKIEHIREAADRGYGPKSLSEVEILGDFPKKKGHAIVAGLDFGFRPVHEFESRFHIVSGTPYCTGGCHGIFLDWLLMMKDRREKWIKRFPEISVFIGKVSRKTEDKKILLIGNCALASDHLEGKKCVSIHGCPPTHKMIVLSMMINFGILAPLVLPSLIWDGFVRYPLKKVKGWMLNIGR